MDTDLLRYIGFILLSVILPALSFWLLGSQRILGRLIASMTCVFFGLRYIWWRWFVSMPEGQLLWQQIWALVFLLFETASVVSSLSVYVEMTRSRHRSPEVDNRKNSSLLSAPVDVFIATYNEEMPILERTMVGAVAIEHPDLRVWVLDDGARPWVRALAEELGVRYIYRVNGKHAKAGNINNGLEIALKEGGRPQFILLLDADFIPAKKILKRILPLFEEEDVGIVQTPQHFFNPDPIQANLLSSSVWPDEQRFFFNYLMPSKDAWGTAFLCGTSAVLRVDALVKCGGIPTMTVTEDVLTTYRMKEEGYRTIYLNEKLSIGLAPEGLREYVTQRTRWCQGAIQQLYTRWSFWGRGNVGLKYRLTEFQSFLYWTSNFPFKLMMVWAPIVYWFTGASVIFSDVNGILFWLGPYVISGAIFMATFGGKTVLPIMTDVSHLLAAPTITKTVVITLIKPWGHSFKVTPKGLRSDGIVVQWRLLTPFAITAILTAVGMIINVSPSSELYGTPGYPVNIFWSVFNIAVLTIASVICIELPKRRSEERFISKETAEVLFFGSNIGTSCVVRDISVSGARLLRKEGWGNFSDKGELILDKGALKLPFFAVRMDSMEIAVKFDLTKNARRDLIRKLFTGDYDKEVKKIRLIPTIVNALKRIFS